jgi:pimeloyl-ACP methyl ester carboxylesterase
MGTLQRQLYPLIILALSATQLVAQSSATTQPAIRFGSFLFRGSDGVQVEADSGTLTVPADRAGKASGIVTIPVVRFKSTSPARRSPVIYLSGGSGSGIAAARGSRFPMFLALRDAGDVITFDLRGAGRSTPRIDCANAVFDLTRLMTYENVVDVLSAQTRQCADSLRRRGVNLQSHNVREVVGDIESIRIALGAQKISLIGISTGTQLALEYMRRHPDRVDRAVLAGVQAPDQNRHLAGEQALVLENLSRQLGPVSNGDRLVDVARRVLDSLSAKPKRIEVPGENGVTPVTLGKFDLQLLISATLGDRRQMSMLPRMLSSAAQGDYTMAAAFKMQASRQGITSAYEGLMDCQTWAPASRISAAQQQARTSLLGNATLDFPEVCAAWGVNVLPDSYRAPVKSAVPSLLISGTLDGRTPVSNADAAARGLQRFTHVVIEGASHGDDLFLSSPEIVPMIVKFLSGSLMPSARRITLTAD